MHSIAWLLDDLFFGDHFWVGFLIEAVFFFVDRRRSPACSPTSAVQKGAPPTPDMAIEEGKRIRADARVRATTPAAKEPTS